MAEGVRCRELRNSARPISVLVHEWFAVVAFGFVEIMSSASELDIRWVMVPLAAIRLDVVKLEPLRFVTPAAGRILEHAPSFVALNHRSFHRRRDSAG